MNLFEVALQQSAIDMNCKPEDFLKTENVIVPAGAHPDARKYLDLPLDCDIVSYGSNVVAAVRPELIEPITEYLKEGPPYRCFETPEIYRLNAILQPFGLQVTHMAEYFLPAEDEPLPRPFKTKILVQKDFESLYLPEWSNALCAKRKELDVLGIGAYDGETLVGLAACSADCENMWQIGIDVLPAYRRQGIASSLVSQLKSVILHRRKVPFYCAAWSNIPSVRCAIDAGFRPAWVQITAKPIKKAAQ